jgi:superfamily II DNA/RNA helicase
LLPRDLEERLPLPARIEWTRRKLENVVHLADETTISVNRFQRQLWLELEVNDWISFSAPTSAGKSYIVTRWVLDLVRRRHPVTIVYLVPTRALISQVEGDLNALVKESSLQNVAVSSLPLARSVSPSRSNILVLTQERLHILSTAVPQLQIDILVVDEAHKVGDGHRGVLLQQVTEQVAAVGQPKVVFATPMASNPEILVADAPVASRWRAFRSNEVTVNQNLVWVNQRPGDPRSWSVGLCRPDEIISIGTIRLGAVPTGERKKLAYVAHALSGNRAGNVVYVNGAAEAEHIAVLLHGLLGGDEGAQADPRLAPLIDLTKRTIHPEFQLARVLSHGVAFHYGNMPLLVRTEIERLFSDGLIRFLVCTSTLIEGVNMSCRNIFVRGPTKGRGRPMNPDDFWNLAGRAGRWGREFQGNVVCIDADRTDVWGESGPPRSRSLYAISRTADTVVGNPGALLAFIQARSPREEAVRHPELEFTFSYLIAEHLRRGTILELPWARRLDRAAVQSVADSIQAIASNLRTPIEVIRRNPGISPLAMDDLLARFARPGRNPEELLPVDPSSNNAVDVYRKILGRIAGELNAGLGPAGRRSHPLALLITRWMRGLPLARLISDRIRWERDHETGKAVPAIIRAVLNDVEQIARFEAPRSLACYNDLLRVHLQAIGRVDLIGQLRDDLQLLLEFGVSLPTQVSLIGLGLSRTSAVLLGELITQDDLDEVGALRWLREGIWQSADLPELVRAEVERILRFHTFDEGAVA